VRGRQHCAPRQSIARHEGKKKEVFVVNGIVCISGVVTVTHRDRSEAEVTVFPKWVSHALTPSRSTASCVSAAW
jgi:hypothetical protein